MRKSMKKAAVAAGALCVLAMTGHAPARAQTAPKEITINVGFGAGGVYHTMAMLLSRHMGRYLPGNPTVVVKAMPGAGSLLAANHIANIAPRDGSTLAVIGGGTILEPLFGNKQARFDPRELNWIGSSSSETYVCVSMAGSKVDKIEDARQVSLQTGSTGRGSRTHAYPEALNELIGTKYKVVAGYQGLTDIHLAMERDELNALCGWGYSSIFSQKPDWLAQKRINILVQFARAKHPDLEDVPLVFDLLRTDADKAAMRMLVIDALVAWPLVAPPKLPADALAALKKAYTSALADPALLTEAKQLKLMIDPVSSEDIHQAVNEVAASPPDVVARARALTGM
jgi:tripartite-type tricarboxylate transporter receptor subunit TctC